MKQVCNYKASLYRKLDNIYVNIKESLYIIYFSIGLKRSEIKPVGLGKIW